MIGDNVEVTVLEIKGEQINTPKASEIDPEKKSNSIR